MTDIFIKINRRERKSSSFIVNSLLIVLIMFLLVGLLCGCKPKRIHREHSDTVAREFEYITKKIDFNFPANVHLSRKQVQEDLDELEWILERRYSYLERKDVDYRLALDSIRSSIDGGIDRGTFALQLMKCIALFGDGHSSIGDPSLSRMGSLYLPFLISKSKDRLVAFKYDRSGFLDEQYSYIVSIDGKEMSLWLEAAGLTVAKGSSQFLYHRSIRNLRHIQYLRRELQVEASEVVEVELQAEDGRSSRKLVMPLTDEFPIYGPWPRTESRILAGNIGYLRILWMSNEPEFLEELVSYMNQFKDTAGLIIDIRGNGGGSRAPLRVLFPFFMAEEQQPVVLNIAAYRLGHRKDILDARWLYPEDWKGWSSLERAAIKQAAEKFKPQWQLPGEQFSKWHYFVVGPLHKAGYYHYEQPVIILMDNQNFSAVDIFLGAFKGWSNVTLMGTASGGGSGRYQRYRLSNSLIQVNFSSMASFQPSGKLYDGNGIQPDIVIEPEPTDFIGKTDSILQKALRRLSENQR